MLFKHNTAVARTANLAKQVAAPELEPEHIADGPAEANPPPDPLEAEIAKLKAENHGLVEQIAAMRRDWDAALAAAEHRSLEKAAAEFRARDAERVELLAKSLASARTDFVNALLKNVDPAARKVASSAIARLLTPRLTENELLTQMISRRLEDLRSDAVVVLHVGPGLPPEQVELLGGMLVPGAELKIDSLQPKGTAKILLRLGQIEINPAEGLNAVLACLEGAPGDACRGAARSRHRKVRALSSSGPDYADQRRRD